MRELLLCFLISANAKSVEEVLAKKLLYDAGYMKSVSPLNPEYVLLDAEKNIMNVISDLHG